MSNLLERLYRTKLALIATVSTATGLGILAAAQWSGLDWLDNSLTAAIGTTLFGTGLIAIVLEAFLSGESDQLSEERLRRVIRSEAGTLRDSVLGAFAARPELPRVASPETLDRIIENALAARFNHAKKAADIYASIKRQVVNAVQTRRDAHALIILTPWDDGPQTGLSAMFVATIRWQYLTDYDLPAALRFSATSDQQRYSELLSDPATIETWFIRPLPGLTVPISDRYRLLECTIDDQRAPIAQAGSDDAQLFTVTNQHAASRPDGTYVTYTQRILAPRSGHRLFIDFPATDGLRVDFSYTAACGIQQVGVVDYNSTGERARIHHSPNAVANPTISLTHEGWIFPHSGAVFTWTLQREIDQ